MSEHSLPARMARRLPGALAALGLTATLAGCYVVPIDPRTGQPVPTPAGRDGGPTAAPTVAQQPPVPAVLQARLYPINPQASRAGMLVATVVDQHGGRGSLSVSYQGDLLQGDATRVGASYPAFGQLHDEVLGSSAQRSYSGQRGIANVYGAKGVSARCEYLMTAAERGTGVCLFSDGAKYQMHFGS
ncbi:hypothetical protein [Eleftheria terrae]|uniref:hypothetical protein n=1 Tax=Eleftheria terrae TaxID=1597781 RepID=UPI00263BDED1|nr:hypothetical protein [Eleftheria terrae]WKB51347.1 hypothetical protein N7L95_16220 [Eleftheria terrae]